MTFTVTVDYKMKIKESENGDKYLDFVTGAFVTIPMV